VTVCRLERSGIEIVAEFGPCWTVVRVVYGSDVGYAVTVVVTKMARAWSAT